MEAKIKKENEDGFGLRVIDPSGVEHRIAVGFDGGILAHQCAASPDDPSDRTNKEDEYNSQLRRFARYYVYRETGHGTVPNTENPDRIAAVLLALTNLSDKQFIEYFGTLYEQAASHDRDGVVPPLDLPSEVYNEGFLVYKQNVYLEEGIEAIQEQLTRPATEVLGDQNLEELASASGDSLVSKAASLVDGGGSKTSDSTEIPGAGLTIEGVSGIDTMYYEDTNEDQTIEGDDLFDREPDARLEIVPTSYERDRFRFYVGHNLVCQIRDCFIGMGLEPPEPFRVLGHGQYKYTGKYRHFEFYEPYFDHEASINGYVSPVMSH
ncbi:hypothetical protein C483_00825 [Natrialba hulunbeirensis JCM 10989]|uniref:Uncharacterized protein n=1 Tax=Natrialba hulunbeirensis JCM 10989 TaxID=1227493 RepID=M0AEL2_9EURY|nr:hypothetical protein [Natrialba hulunbeirensis]ELY95778.1 hypothetical protein C483_00825 [Natrialba hulunbeirensis JCM 10989]